MSPVPNSGPLAVTRQLNRLARLGARLARRRIATLHHLASSGGTLFAKCVAAMPEAIVLSEIHPDRTAQPAYHPHIQLRIGYPAVLTDQQLWMLDDHFVREIELAHDIAAAAGRRLVVRDHAHVDFVFRNAGRSRLVELLRNRMTVDPVVTVRDPIDLWPSLRANGWFDGTPETLCQRQLALLDAFPGAPVFRYEDLVAAPEKTVRALCAALGVPFESGFEDRLREIRHLTGDSGRSGGRIAPRQRKPVPAETRNAFAAAPAYAALCERLGYAAIVEST